MPSTPIYGLPFSEFTQQPGVTLHGGLPPSSPILAEEVEEELARIDSDVAGVSGDVTALETLFLSTGVQTIATIDTGQGTNTTEFVNIPQTFRNLVIDWTGVSDGATEIDSLALRFNGDATDAYVSRLSRNNADGTFQSTDGILDNFVFSVLRGGYVGTNPNRRSGGTVWIPDYSRAGVTKHVHGTSFARGQSGGTNVFNVIAGGTWTGTSAITAVRIWVSGQLWEVDPHITLIGIP